MPAYYNENDAFAAQWLRNLIAENLIAPGDVDERDIRDVKPDDLKGYEQHHFFAGIGGWSYALRLAGWPDDRPVWTGSCPCQPFSAAGKQSGGDDERHLWLAWFRLARECGPDTILGEQVEGAVGFGWLDRVFADLENEGYACGAAVLGAHSVGAPHIRQRLWWLAEDDKQPAQGRSAKSINKRSTDSRLGNAAISRPQGRQEHGAYHTGYSDTDGGLGDTDQPGPQGHQPPRHMELQGRAGQVRPTWQASISIQCGDGKIRRVPTNEAGEIEPALFPLADGLPNRVGTLRGSGNAINPFVAAEFIKAAMQ